MINFPLPRIDLDDELRDMLLPYCRIKEGTIWKDPLRRHKIACIDATDAYMVKKLMGRKKAVLAVHDPPYNFIAFKELQVIKFTLWCEQWISNTFNSLSKDASLYVWLGADQKKHYEPLPEFITMMTNSGFQSR